MLVFMFNSCICRLFFQSNIIWIILQIHNTRLLWSRKHIIVSLCVNHSSFWSLLESTHLLDDWRTCSQSFSTLSANSNKQTNQWLPKKKNKKNGQVNYYNIASVALFIACYCDNVMLVMRCSLMSWDNGELAASKLIHRCSFHWFFPMGGGCCCWARLRVQNSFFPFCPSGILCHFLSKQTRDVLACIYCSIILSFLYKACTILRWSKVCLFSKCGWIMSREWFYVFYEAAVSHLFPEKS